MHEGTDEWKKITLTGAQGTDEWKRSNWCTRGLMNGKRSLSLVHEGTDEWKKITLTGAQGDR